jgi:SOS-response transcriptional repressor LexA
MGSPTKKQRALLKFIQDFTVDNDFSPSYREIQHALGLKSVSAVAEHINNCVAAGYLKKIPNAARSLEVIPLENHEETQRLFQKKIAELSEKPDSPEVRDDIATLKAAAKLLDLAI